MGNGSKEVSPAEQHVTELNTWLNFKRLIRHAFPYRAASFFAIFCMLGYASIDVYFLSKLPALIDEGLTGKNPEFMKWAPLFVIVCFILRGTFHFLSNYCLAWVGNNVVADLRQKIFKHVMAMPVAFHDSTSTGTLISKLTFDTEQVLQAVSKSLLTLVQQGGFVIGLLFLMFWESWQLSAIFLVITPIIAVIVTIVSKRFRKISKNIQNAMGEVTSAAEQTFNGHKVVITFDGQERENDRFYQINKHNRQQRMKMVTAKSASVPIIQIIASFALAFVLYVATLDGFVDSLTPGVFMGVVTYMTMLLRPLKLLTNVNNEFQRGMAASSSIFELLDKQPEQETGDKVLEQSQGALTVRNVSFAYPNEEKLTLDNISFHANTGETIALVGRSGSGKSTLTSLLLRFYQAQKGEILIDDTDISTLTIKSLRRQFAYVSQQVVLFNDSLANNIAYAKPEASREEIIAAAKKAHVLEFADKLPQGLDTNIGDNGALLSGGQRQRVAIARALLCDAPFLILDEATSALDTESERHIQDALTELQQQRTSIIIAHRLSTIESATNILVIDQGKVIEQGNHEALLAQDGAYAQLHKFQFAQ
ncbi:lipid A export permease/ATP-binding protein MsbA [Thalassotalea euphylliae]|uniref:Lipid A export permease/ATP-binding protein MsbA n=1 Tax=Thalassotalea euphylliae TaxID=1655234 RepID=A0A3E0UJU7_9GAMM|nr:lipid A export permease/ATP-binding protein MsbA [Thalassotalea euphylliae]REL37150.1 lipid A export permease/ATP-binding protein MsbA [Thalassotalea euphylliae]